MRVILNNFGYLPNNARDLAIAVRNDEELNNFCLAKQSIRVACCQTSTKSYFHRNRGGSSNPATTNMELYLARLLDLLPKRNKII